jgi:antitoxin component YwqK of YwqJK toxin-antitoxin module
MKRKIFYLLVVLVSVAAISCTDRNNGISEEFYPDGTIKSQITLKNGIRNGITKNYDEKGRLISTAEYVNDVREGLMMNYNPENGKLTAKAMYKADEQDGPVTLFYKEGKLFRESTYIKGRVDGIIKTYWPSGNLKAENTFRMGKPSVGLKEYDKDGKTLIIQPSIVISRLPSFKDAFKVSLSDGSADVDFYLDYLDDDKYFNPKTHSLRLEDGVATLKNPRHTSNRIVIVAKVKTKFGNTLILQKFIDF